MKFYNPFKPHIVLSSNGKFAIRELGMLGWVYYDNKSPSIYNWDWFDSTSIKKWALFTTIEKAETVLQKYKEDNKRITFTVLH